MDIQLNTLYVFTLGSYIRRDHRNVVIEADKLVKATIPIHHLDAVAVFGPSIVSPGAMELCHEQGVSLTFLSESGRVIARVDAPMSGNVLVRREQFRRADRFPSQSSPPQRRPSGGRVHSLGTPSATRLSLGS